MSTSKRVRRRTAAVLGAGAVALVVAAPGIASADTAPPIWQVGGSSYATLGDPFNVGTLKFFGPDGTQITTGSAAAGFSYIEVDGLPSTDLSGDRAFVVLYAATPAPSTPAGSFSTKTISSKAAWPNGSAPGALASDTNPLFSGSLAKQNDSLDTYAKSFPQTSTATGYANVYEIRAFLTGGDGITQDYASADVQVDPTTDTWTQIFPAVAAVTTPPTSLPEAPVAALIPLSALAIAGVVVSRRRRSSAADTIR